MKKFLFLFIAVVFSFFSANASYLYWAVGDDGFGGNDDLEKVKEYAGVVGDWTSATLHISDSSGKEVANQTLPNLAGSVGPTYIEIKDVSSLNNYSYYVELVNSSTLVGYTKGTYTSSVTLYEEPVAEIGASTAIWHGGSYNAPEPTSALLMLLGTAGLALRRKKRKNDEV